MQTTATIGFGLFLCLGLATAQDKKESVVVKLDKFGATAPADWVNEKPINRLRSYQFKIPGVKDAKDGELYVFPNLTKSVKENFERYKADITPPPGKGIDDVSKVEKFKIGDKIQVDMLDCRGAWTYKERPFDPKAKTELRPDSRVISVIVETPDGNYLIRLAGPAPTIDHHYKAFIEWLKAMK